MNILILGGARNVGYLLTKRLVAAGHDVTHLHRTPRNCAGVRDLVGDRSNLPAADIAVDFTAYRGDDVRPVLLPGGGPEICRHVYSGSVVDAIAKLVEDPKPGAFNLAQDEEPTLAELVTMLGEIAGVRPRIVAGSAPSPFSTRWMSRLDPSKAKRELGFRHLPLREVLGRIVAHHLAM